MNKKRKSDNIKDSENKIARILTCRECGIKLTDENWYAYYKKKHSYICKECNYEYHKKWQQNNKNRQNQLQNESNHRLRDEVINEYGGKCACCGEERKEYLSIDHINGGGRKHRKEMGFSNSDQFYRWLRQNDYPKEFQVLCFNCNCAKRNYNICPQSKDFQILFEEKLEESYDARYRWDLRLNIIEGYGGKWELCGKDNLHYLTIDHIDGINTEEEKKFRSGEALYRKLRDENYPKDNYRLLCYNCNCALGFNRITEEDVILQENKIVK